MTESEFESFYRLLDDTANIVCASIEDEKNHFIASSLERLSGILCDCRQEVEHGYRLLRSLCTEENGT